MEAFTFFGIFVLLLFVLILFVIYCIIYLFTDFIPKIRVIFPEYTIMTRVSVDDPVRFLKGLWAFVFFGFLSGKRRNGALEIMFNIQDIRLLERDELESGITNLNILTVIFFILFIALLAWTPVMLIAVLI